MLLKQCKLFKSFLKSSPACKGMATSADTRPMFTFLSTNYSKKEYSYFPISPGNVSPMRSIPKSIKHPEYSITGVPHNTGNTIFTVKSNTEELKKLKKSAQLARRMLEFACSLAKPGMSTDEIDQLTHNEIIKNCAYPSPINYCGFPKAICTSINEVVCHGIPDDRKLQEGDILSIDVSIFLDGYHGDNCGTIIVGNKSDDIGVKLIKATQEALDAGIAVCKPGACLSSIGEAIENVASSYKFKVIHEFLGHGTGPNLHMSPMVRHYKNNTKLTLVPGMIFTIEPILCEGSRKIALWSDGWTAVTVDGGRAAQFEHEVYITENGAEILTL